jgi:hypothetical protein
MAKQHFYLSVEIEGLGLTGEFPLSDFPCTVGRAPDCGLQLDFDRISRQHARFDLDDDQLRIADLGSTNGTFVNHERIESSTPVHPGDTIHFGNHAFELKHRSPGGDTLMPGSVPSTQRSGDTIVGFTAAPTGFPVQAPEFFEILNDELISATSQAIKTASGVVMGHTLRGCSTHPRLKADAAMLFRLAEDLGEENRLATLCRRICLEQADQAGMQSSLFIEVHPLECEEPDILADEITSLMRQFRHLALVLELPLNAFDSADRARKLCQKLTAVGLEVCGHQPTDTTVEAVSEWADLLDYLSLPASTAPETVSALSKSLGSDLAILIHGLDQANQLESFSQVGAELFQGAGIARPRDVVDK